MKSEIMTSANLRAPIEGRSQALKKSHKAAKGVLVASDIVVMTLAQQSRLLSDFTPKEKVVEEFIDGSDIDMRMS